MHCFDVRAVWMSSGGMGRGWGGRGVAGLGGRCEGALGGARVCRLGRSGVCSRLLIDCR